METKIKEHCGNCKFFKPYEHEVEDYEHTCGFCRRYPPVLWAKPEVSDAPEQWSQPRVEAHIDYCGEWKILDNPIQNNISEDNSIYALGFSSRVFSILRINKVIKVKDLLKLSAMDLLKFNHFGRKCLFEVSEKLEKNGLKLCMTN